MQRGGSSERIQRAAMGACLQVICKDCTEKPCPSVRAPESWTERSQDKGAELFQIHRDCSATEEGEVLRKQSYNEIRIPHGNLSFEGGGCSEGESSVHSNLHSHSGRHSLYFLLWHVPWPLRFRAVRSPLRKRLPITLMFNGHGTPSPNFILFYFFGHAAWHAGS